MSRESVRQNLDSDAGAKREKKSLDAQHLRELERLCKSTHEALKMRSRAKEYPEYNARLFIVLRKIDTPLRKLLNDFAMLCLPQKYTIFDKPRISSTKLIKASDAFAEWLATVSKSNRQGNPDKLDTAVNTLMGIVQFALLEEKPDWFGDGSWTDTLLNLAALPEVREALESPERFDERPTAKRGYSYARTGSRVAADLMVKFVSGKYPPRKSGSRKPRKRA